MSAVARIWARMRTSRTVVISGAILSAIALVAVIGPWISPNEYVAADFGNILRAPTLSAGHVFGTDDLGRDLFVRTMMGVQVTFAVAIVASVVSLVIGVLYGAVMMRLVDTLYATPFIFFVILLLVVFERNFLLIFVAIGAINWLDMARIVRGQTLSLREREFVQAAQLIGVSTPRIILRHIAPNLVGVVIVYVTLTIPQAILIESFLSFLGLGIQEPQTSLGKLVNDGTDQMEGASWMLLIPAMLLAAILLCFNFLGDGMRDLLDSRQSR